MIGSMVLPLRCAAPIAAYDDLHAWSSCAVRPGFGIQFAMLRLSASTFVHSSNSKCNASGKRAMSQTATASIHIVFQPANATLSAVFLIE